MRYSTIGSLLSFRLIFVFLTNSTVFSEDSEKDNKKVSVSPYGFVKLDVIYETGRGSHGNFIVWANDPGDSDGLFYVTAKETRLGLAIKGIKFGNFNVTGRWGVDFHTSGAPENKAYNYMRFAFMKISNGSFSIIAGQYWDIICPLNPSTLNYPVMWGGGNIGYRRPQLSFWKEFKIGSSVFILQTGIFRTITSDYDGVGINDGLEAGFPTVQGRIAGKFELGKGKNTSLQLGLSGHYGKSKGDMEYTSDSLNVDFLLVLSPKFKILAEYFSGKNLGAFLGGIVQNVNVNTKREIKSRGFYVNAVASFSKRIRVSVGYGTDDPNNENLSTGFRSRNATFFL